MRSAECEMVAEIIKDRLHIQPTRKMKERTAGGKTVSNFKSKLVKDRLHIQPTRKMKERTAGGKTVSNFKFVKTV